MGPGVGKVITIITIIDVADVSYFIPAEYVLRRLIPSPANRVSYVQAIV